MYNLLVIVTMWNKVNELSRQSYSQAQITQLLGVHRDTVRRYQSMSEKEFNDHLLRENFGDYVMTEEFAKYVAEAGYEPVFCMAADPQSKGLVENVVRYVKGNFLLGRTYINI